MKFKKKFKTNLNLATVKHSSILKGNYAIISIEPCKIMFKHLERVRRKISKQFKQLEKKVLK